MDAVSGAGCEKGRRASLQSSCQRPWRLPGRRSPQAYIPMLQEDLRAMERLSEAETYKEICGILSAPMFRPPGRRAGERMWTREKGRPFRSSGTGSRTA